MKWAFLSSILNVNLDYTDCDEDDPENIIISYYS